MAGKFYTLQEVVEKLGKSEDEVRGLVKEGKLNEFRDGSKLLFKVEDVEELAKNPDMAGSDSFIELMPDESEAGEGDDEFLSSLENTKVDDEGGEEEKAEEPEQEEPAPEGADETLGFEGEEEPSEQPVEITGESQEGPKEGSVSDTLGLEDEGEEQAGQAGEIETEAEEPEKKEEAEEADESIGLAETDTSESEGEGVQLSADDLDVDEDSEESFFKHLGDTTEAAGKEVDTDEEKEEPSAEADEESPSESVVELEGLDEPEKTESKAQGDDLLADLTSADTNVETTGVDVLAGEDEFEVSEDSMGETKLGTDEEDSGLGDLDDDLNLDSVGSGSGLLDLSLQADDTSLGAVLDDILPAEEAEGEAAMPEPDSASISQEADDIMGGSAAAASGGSAAVAAPEPQQYGVPAAAARVVETPPDAKSNALGVSLLLPMVATIYAVIVVISAIRGVTPTILTGVEGYIMYGAIGLAVVVALIDLIGVAMDSSGGGGGTKTKKKKTKKAKPKKEKKAKPKKEKKSKKKKKK
ncbi:helix-turn-helix domain-containing protein [Anaerohalosphaera lusitana]|nr:helix-turn-helix domain-containing protein [Anaerohalosphaera lusitana]